jgi:hypothetical protein
MMILLQPATEHTVHITKFGFVSTIVDTVKELIIWLWALSPAEHIGLAPFAASSETETHVLSDHNKQLKSDDLPCSVCRSGAH